MDSDLFGTRPPTLFDDAARCRCATAIFGSPKSPSCLCQRRAAANLHLSVSTCALYALEANASHVLNSHIDLVLQDMANKWRGRLTDTDYEGIQRVLQSEGATCEMWFSPCATGFSFATGVSPPDKQYRIAAVGGAALEGLREANPGRPTDAEEGKDKGVFLEYSDFVRSLILVRPAVGMVYWRKDADLVQTIAGLERGSKTGG